MGLLLLSACSGAPYAPVSERNTVAQRPVPYRIVNAGDTLYSIAWEAKLDYHELARWNGLSSSYIIKPGQRLRLRPEPQPKQARLKTSVKKPVKTWSKAAVKLAVGKKSPQRTKQHATRSRPIRWSWPTKGKVIKRFSTRRRNNGVDIGGRSGQPIRAAAHGKIAYLGSGLRGYGKLIIIEHDELFLSAYAHNKKLLVRQGQKVRRGEQIASMGSTDTNRTKLHFEIRRRGIPVNPLRYLPKKK